MANKLKNPVKRAQRARKLHNRKKAAPSVVVKLALRKHKRNAAVTATPKRAVTNTVTKKSK